MSMTQQTKIEAKIPKTVKEKWNKEQRDNFLGGFVHYINPQTSLAIVLAGDKEIEEYLETINGFSFFGIKKNQKFDFSGIESKYFKVNPCQKAKYSYQLIRRFIRSERRIIFTEHEFPLLIRYKPGLWLTLAPTIDD